MSTQSERIEKVIAKTSDLKDGEMKEFEVGEGKVLLVRENGEFRAFSSKCTHYGAPLAKGVLSGGRIRCPWHGACFSSKTGDIEDAPALDALKLFQTKVTGEEVVVIVENKKDLEGNGRVPTMCSRKQEDDRTFVIVGGGAAGLACAESLREENFTGKIIILTKEKVLPYDRTKLSKAPATPTEKILLRPESFYKEYDLEVQLNKTVKDILVSESSVLLEDGSKIKYDQLLVATGGSPRNLPIPGADGNNVFLLREPHQANSIAAATDGKKVVILGSSFIALEVASGIAKKAKSVSIVSPDKISLARVLGDRIGAAVQKIHENNGIKFYMERSPKEITKDAQGNVTSVRLDNGDILEAEAVVIGVGVSPNTSMFEKELSHVIQKDKSILADSQLKVVDGIYVAGDIAKFPHYLGVEGPIRIEHWQSAQNLGRIAGLNMVGKETPFRNVPYFWTVHYGKSIRYCGYASTVDEVIIHGNVPEVAKNVSNDKVESVSKVDAETLKFTAFYIQKGKLVAVASLGSDPIVSLYAEKFELGEKLPSVEELREGAVLAGSSTHKL